MVPEEGSPPLGDKCMRSDIEVLEALGDIPARSWCFVARVGECQGFDTCSAYEHFILPAVQVEFPRGHRLPYHCLKFANHCELTFCFSGKLEMRIQA